MEVRELINKTSQAPDLSRVAVGVVPPGPRTDSGIVVVGLGVGGCLCVLRDSSTPKESGVVEWCQETVRAVNHHSADKVVLTSSCNPLVWEMLRNAGVSRPKLREVVRNRSRVATLGSVLRSAGNIIFTDDFPDLEEGLVQVWSGTATTHGNRVNAFLLACVELVLAGGARGS